MNFQKVLLQIDPPPSPSLNCYSVFPYWLLIKRRNFGIMRNSKLISEHNTGIKTGGHRENKRDLPSISRCKTVVN